MYDRRRRQPEDRVKAAAAIVCVTTHAVALGASNLRGRSTGRLTDRPPESSNLRNRSMLSGPTVRRQCLLDDDVGGLATTVHGRAGAVIGRLQGAIEGGARPFDEGYDELDEQSAGELPAIQRRRLANKPGGRRQLFAVDRPRCSRSRSTNRSTTDRPAERTSGGGRGTDYRACARDEPVKLTRRNVANS
jgi:hypothetical protein